MRTNFSCVSKLVCTEILDHVDLSTIHISGHEEIKIAIPIGITEITTHYDKRPIACLCRCKLEGIGLPIVGAKRAKESHSIGRPHCQRDVVNPVLVEIICVNLPK